MIPPVSPDLLAGDPSFEKLHSRLVTDILENDASTRSLNLSRVPDQLEARRIDSVRSGILNLFLLDLANNDDLPPDLRDLLLVAATYSSDAPALGLIPEEHDLLHQYLAPFYLQLPDISTLLSQKLSTQYAALQDVALASHDDVFETKIPSLGPAPRRNRAYRADKPALLHELVDSQVAHLTHLRTVVLPNTMYETTNSLILLLQSQAQHLRYLIRHLEQRKHGADARHSSAQAQFLSSVAQGLQGKINVSYLEQRRDLYSPDLVARLDQRMGELDDEEEALGRREKELKTALAEYEEAGLDIMRTLGKKYGDIEKEVQEVRDDIKKLSNEHDE